MKSMDSNLQCPSCQGALRPKILGCDACGIRVEGPFQLNEFATLSADDLHFLRIFLRCEGRVREMEAALGLSYPTIRARITALKNKVLGEEPAPRERTEPNPAAQVLERLEKGEIPFDEAMRLIKKDRKK
jgi:hypothetical protein